MCLREMKWLKIRSPAAITRNSDTRRCSQAMAGCLANSVTVASSAYCCDRSRPDSRMVVAARASMAGNAQ